MADTQPQHADYVVARCCSCGDEIEDGFDIRDDDGNVYCEGCWTP